MQEFGGALRAFFWGVGLATAGGDAVGGRPRLLRPALVPPHSLLASSFLRTRVRALALTLALAPHGFVGRRSPPWLAGLAALFATSLLAEGRQ